MISQGLLNELQTIIREDYGVEVPMAEVSEIGNGLVNFVETLAKVAARNDNYQQYENGDDHGTANR